MDDTPILQTTPLSDDDTFLQQKYRESIANQPELMDKLASQLITLELAIPGLYATVLKLTQGDDATLPASPWLLYATFGCWLLALVLTLATLTPKTWRVNRDVLIQQDRARYASDGMGIEDFFNETARYKKRLLIPAIALLWLGILFATLLVFNP